MHGDRIEVKLSFGAGLDYAVQVHEDVETHHDDGQPKFLESAVLESAADIPERVARRLVRMFGGD